MKIVVSFRATSAGLELLRTAASGHGVVAVSDLDQARAEIRSADAFLGNRFFLQSLPLAPGLRWMQSNSAGVDVILGDANARSHPFVLTAARGIYDEEVADHALGLLYALFRDLPGAVRAAGRGEWLRRHLPHLSSRRALVFGFGGIGQAVTRRLVAARADVTVVRRSGGAHPVADALGASCVDPAAGLARLEHADAVVLALPLTRETRGLFGRDVLARLRDGAYLVNVARGALVDETALREHVERLGGVGLDVFSEEPLPEGHWLRTHPRALVTPHVARSPDSGEPPWLPLFARNLRAFVRGDPLAQVVDKERGY